MERTRCPHHRTSIGTDEIVELHGSAFIEAAIRAGRTDQHAGVGKIDAERGSPRIDVFVLGVDLELSSHEHGDLLLVLALERLGDLGVATPGITADEFLVKILHKGVIIRGESETFHVRIQVSSSRQPLD